MLPERSFFTPQEAAEWTSQVIRQLPDGDTLAILTYADAIVDRLRIERRLGALQDADVAVHYVDGGAVHVMPLDRHGNLTNAPAHYRAWETAETDRLLGLRDDFDAVPGTEEAEATGSFIDP